MFSLRILNTIIIIIITTKNKDIWNYEDDENKEYDD